ncbi:MAG: hypothetical protein WC611_09575 [Candidatus Neomarinimicrobiota bacterium]|jgi:uncharacterized integral membrane protein
MFKTDNIFSSFYNHFILRDIIHIFCGGILIYFIFMSDAINGDFEDFLELFFSNLYRFILLLLLSYISGLIISFIASIIRIAPRDIQLPEAINSQLDLMKVLKNNYDYYGVNFFERQTCIEIFSASMATSLLLSLVPLIYLYFYWEENIALLFLLTNLILSSLLIYISKSTHKYIENEINQLFSKING